MIALINMTTSLTSLQIMVEMPHYIEHIFNSPKKNIEHIFINFSGKQKVWHSSLSLLAANS